MTPTSGGSNPAISFTCCSGMRRTASSPEVRKASRFAGLAEPPLAYVTMGVIDNVGSVASVGTKPSVAPSMAMCLPHQGRQSVGLADLPGGRPDCQCSVNKPCNSHRYNGLTGTATPAPDAGDRSQDRHAADQCGWFAPRKTEEGADQYGECSGRATECQCHNAAGDPARMCPLSARVASRASAATSRAAAG